MFLSNFHKYFLIVTCFCIIYCESKGTNYKVFYREEQNNRRQVPKPELMVPKCCSLDQSLTKNRTTKRSFCDKIDKEHDYDFSPILYDRMDATEYTIYKYTDLNVVVGNPCGWGKYILTVYEAKKYKYHILKNGHLWIPGDQVPYGLDDYCVDHYHELNSSDPPILKAYVCKGRKRKRNKMQTKVFFQEKDPVPTITDESEAHLEGHQLKLSCKMDTNRTDLLFLKWILPVPTKQIDSRLQIRNEPSSNGIKQIILSNISVEDSGTYICSFWNNSTNIYVNQTISVNVREKPFIHLKRTRALSSVTLKYGLDTVFEVNVDAYPTVKYEWFLNKNKILKRHPDYQVINSPNHTQLSILNASFTDRGQYVLCATNKYGSDSIDFTLEVIGEPQVSISGPSFVLPNHNQPFYCKAKGNPIPEIHWSFREFGREIKTMSSNSTEVNVNLLEVTSRLLFKTDKYGGDLVCEAKNTEGTVNETKEVILSDIPDGDTPNDLATDFNAWMEDDTVITGDSVVFYCASLWTNITDWYLNDGDEPLKCNKDCKISRSSTKYSFLIKLKTPKLTKSFDGVSYRCDNEGGTPRSKSIIVKVSDPEPPVIIDSNLEDQEISVNAYQRFTYYCVGKGLPSPTIVWKKNNIVWLPDPKRIKILSNNQTVIFISTTKEDEGRYSCEVANRFGKNVTNSALFIQTGGTTNANNTQNSHWIIIGIVAIIVCIIILSSIFVITILIINLRHKKAQIAELANTGLDHFEDGNVASINPDLTIGTQADLLPYYDEWEFPRDRLKLGAVLGTGEFGVVMRAEALGIVAGEEKTVVAVKRNADYHSVKALVSELKILVHMGPHINVANLLGACTKNLASKRELFVIVEYCRYGNLLNYLQRHRKDFVNQIDSTTGYINGLIGASNSPSSQQFSPEQPSCSFFNRTVQAMEYKIEPERMNLESAEDQENVTISNDGCGQQQSNHQAALCTQDLLSWAFQIALGMQYLVCRRVLHGDLAARNILLGENNVVKICDFGLAKNINNNSNYVRQKNCRLPIKWMALESIRDRIFSIQSDVWSYGVVLWEIFSMGQTPYTEISEYDKFYQQLLDGYRLIKPEFATNKLYQIMLKCWEAHPRNRPLFNDLADIIGSMLENHVREVSIVTLGARFTHVYKLEHFVNLNSPYLAMNNIKMKDRSDYLAMMSVPDFDMLTSPRLYVNDLPTASTSTDACYQDNANSSNTGYLCMRPTLGSNDLNKTKQGKKPHGNGATPEMLPMLSLNTSNNTKSDTESDGDTAKPDYQNISVNSFLNPSYKKFVTQELLQLSEFP